MCPSGDQIRHYLPHFDEYGRVKPHLRAFYPLVENLTDGDATDDRPSAESHPINLGIIREWLRVCGAHHGPHCGQGGETVSRVGGSPKLVIDVQDMCVVPAADDQPYLALSYVWERNALDSNSFLRLEESTRAELMKKGQLEVERRRLPETIRNVMDVVRGLGMRYLWVDRLCIDQGHSTGKQDEIANMAEIYANAFLTIVAAQGNDATDPLWSGSLVDGDPIELSVPPPPSNCRSGEGHEGAPSHLAASTPPPDSNTATTTATRKEIMHGLTRSLVLSPWWGRGWTFQEYYFSRRKLIFHAHTVTWECHCASWHEGQRALDTRQCEKRSRESCAGGRGGASFDLDPWPNFHRFARMMCLFNARHLTYPEDAMDALDGALSTFSTVFHGGFISGLPQMMFDAALCWQPYYPMDRREAQQEKCRGAILPSWSPLGWCGSIHSEDWVAGFNYVCEEHASHTKSTVEWEYWNMELGSWILIDVSAENLQRRFSQSGGQLPEGWRHFDNCLKHASDAVQKFWYPVPICDLDSPRLRPIRPVRAPRIRGLTSSVTLTAVPRSSQHTKQPGQCADALLCMDTGLYVGYIRLNETEGQAERQICHLIELSRGSTTFSDGFGDRYTEYYYGDEFLIPRDRPYEFVNVMSVEKHNGTYYRRAIGRVQEHAWEALGKAELEVAIG